MLLTEVSSLSPGNFVSGSSEKTLGISGNSAAGTWNDVAGNPKNLPVHRWKLAAVNPEMTLRVLFE